MPYHKGKARVFPLSGEASEAADTAAAAKKQQPLNGEGGEFYEALPWDLLRTRGESCGLSDDACADASSSSERNGGKERPPDTTIGAVGINEPMVPVRSEMDQHLTIATLGNPSGNFGSAEEVPMDTAERAQTRVDVENVEGRGGEGISSVDNPEEHTQDGAARGELKPMCPNGKHLM